MGGQSSKSFAYFEQQGAFIKIKGEERKKC